MKYEANDIVSLSAGRAFREKIGMYLSADKQEAINLGLRELIVNVQDEYEVYKPENPTLTIQLFTNTKEICVIDNMRGIPVGIRDDGMNSLTAAFLIPHSGGKHTEGVYSSAVGINGEGNKIVCHTAEWLKVEVHRDGKRYTQEFKSNDEGAFAVGPVQEEPFKVDLNSHGTYIKYKPDPKVYGDIFIDIKALRQMLKEMAMFSTGLKITLEVDGKKEVFYSNSGLIDGLSKENRISNPFSYHYETDDCKVDLALQWVSKKGQIRGYANNLYMPDGGAFITGFKTSLTKTFNGLAKTKYEGDVIRDVLDGYVSVKVKMGQFTNQQKTALANPEARTAAAAAITECLKQFATQHKDEFDKVVELLERVTKAERAAEKARQSILKNNKDIEKNFKRKVFASDKLKDARKLGNNSVLLICEGDSALGSLAQARDPNVYGLLGIRGKIINAMSNPLDKVLDNEEVKLIYSALGITPNSYNPKKLRYGQIGIASDMDKDGNHIALLILSLFATLTPQLLEEGRIFRLDSPTHIVKQGKKNYYFYSDAEFQSRKAKGDVVLVKGLGELGAAQAEESMFGENQHRTYFEWDGNTTKRLAQFMGEDVTPRKEYVFSKIDFSKIVE